MTRTLQLLTGGLLLLAAPWPALGAVLKVPARYSTIQAAVTAAGAGDVIEVADGIYEENVLVDNSGKDRDGLQIVGRNPKKVIIDAGTPTGGPALRILSANVTVARLAVRHSSGDGILCRAAGCTVLSVTALNNGRNGVTIIGENAVVESSTLTGNKGAGLSIQNGDGARVAGNTAANNGRGLDLAGDDMLVEDNTVRVANNEGIQVSGHRNTVRKNRVSFADGPGLSVKDGDGHTVEGNRVEVTGSDCIAVNGDGSTVAKNHVEACGGDGIRVVGRNPQVVRNQVRQVTNGAGLDVQCKNDCRTMVVSGNQVAGTVHHDGIRVDVPSLGGGQAVGWLVEKNQATENVGNGLRITGSTGLILTNQARRNGSGNREHGLLIEGGGNLIQGNRAGGNSGDGLHVTGANNVLKRNKADGNNGIGIHLARQGSSTTGNTLERNTAKKNQADGIQNAGTNTALIRNVAKGNRVDCTSDFTGSPAATVAVNDRNKCADGTDFAVTQSSEIH